MKDRIKAVVFDYGGVISFPPLPEEREAIASMAGISPGRLDGLDRKRRVEYDRGLFDGAGYYRAILSDGGIVPDGESPERMALADMDSWKRINPDTERLMKDLEALGCAVAILSNMPFDFLAWARENIPLFTRYPGVFSCEAGAVKPEPVIYERLVSLLGRAFGEVVFFDDLRQNVDGALSMGIRAFVFTDGASARKALRSIDDVFAGL
ncbi:MAG: HAD family phosphatase [Treponema sp.]|jgi:putative hydrolase of the HAD superfamily|nr:HAD family phosphatase [Treponema sp.]